MKTVCDGSRSRLAKGYAAYSQTFYIVELTWNDTVEDRGRLITGCS